MSNKQMMNVIVNGKTEQREVSHEQKNQYTSMFEKHPVLRAGETMQRDSNGTVYVITGAHQ